MKNFLMNIESKLQEWKVDNHRWAGFNERVYAYWSNFYHQDTPWYGKAVKLVLDTWDYVSYNACAFMGMLFCALVLF